MNDYSDLDRSDRWWIAGIERRSIPAILIVAIARIVPACCHKIAGVFCSDPDDRNDDMETRLKKSLQPLIE